MNTQTAHTVETPEETDIYHAPRSETWILGRASWGAIIAGVFIAIAIQLVFTLVGVSIGTATIDPQQDSSYLGGFGFAAGVWTLIGVAVGMFCGGWAAGRMAGVPRATDAMMHGAVVWALTAIVSFYLMTTAIGSLVSAASGVVGTALRATMQGAQTVASATGATLGSAAQSVQGAIPDDAAQRIQQSAQAFLRDLGISRETVDRFLQQSQQRLGTAAERAAVNPDQAYAAAQSALTDIYQRGANVLSEVDRQDAARALAENTGLSQEQATTAIQRWSEQAQQLRQQASQLPAPSEAMRQAGNAIQGTAERAADKVAGGISAATGWLAGAYVLGLLMAVIGGKVGEPHEVHELRSRRTV